MRYHLKKLNHQPNLWQNYIIFSDGSDQDARTTATYIHIIFHLLPSKGFIASFLTTTLDHIFGCANQHCFESIIYKISYLALEFCIIIYIAVGAYVHGKDVVYDMNVRNKLMLKLSM